MINYIWVGMLAIGIITGIINGKIDDVSIALVDSAKNAVELCIGLAGMLILWNGIMQIAKKGGAAKFISSLLKPVLKILFRKIPAEHPAKKAMAMNITANILGLANAATPLGLKAMKELDSINPDKSTATDEMCMFLVINTSALQLIPSTIIGIRHALGCSRPSEIILPAILASTISLFAGISAVFILRKVFDRQTLKAKKMNKKGVVKPFYKFYR